MGRHHVRVEGEVEASAEVVWAMLADASGYSSWALMSVSKLERWGEPAPDGVGAIRNFGSAGVMSREQVVEFAPPSHLGYVLLSGLPIDDYRADVRLTALGPQRCRIVWEGVFTAGALKGAAMRGFLSMVLGDFVRRLRREAPKRATRLV